MSDERGLAYCPAIRPTLTTGTEAAYVSTTAICSSTRSLLRTLSAVTPAKVSAQSPPWSRNASPRATARDLGLEVVALPREHQRRHGAQPGDGGVDGGAVGVRRLLGRAERVQRREVGDASPAQRTPADAPSRRVTGGQAYARQSRVTPPGGRCRGIRSSWRATPRLVSQVSAHSTTPITSSPPAIW